MKSQYDREFEKTGCPILQEVGSFVCRNGCPTFIIFPLDKL